MGDDIIKTIDAVNDSDIEDSDARLQKVTVGDFISLLSDFDHKTEIRFEDYHGSACFLTFKKERIGTIESGKRLSEMKDILVMGVDYE